MKRFIDTPTVITNRYKQKTTTGRIFLSKNFQLTNNANDGKTYSKTITKGN